MNKQMLEAGVEGSGAGGSALTGTNVVAGQVNTGEKIGNQNAPAWHALPDKWQDSLPEDIRSEASLKQFSDFPSLVKSFVHAQKAIGAEKVVVPGKHATAQDWKEFYKKTGTIPESIDKYEVKVPDALDKTAINKLKAKAYELNISPKQFEPLLEAYAEDLKNTVVQSELIAKEKRDAGIKGLKDEWGVKYKENLSAAQTALKKFADDNLIKILESTGLGDHPAIIKAFSKMGESLVEHTIEKGQSTDSQLYTPKEAQARANTILADRNHPYHLGDHPNHKSAVDEVNALFGMAYPEGT